MIPKIKDIISAIKQVAPLKLQENYDNSGLQVGNPEVVCSGVLLCVDPTVEIVQEAAQRGFNLIVSHHPLLFHGVKCVSDRTRSERVLAEAIRNDIAIYSAHTSLDSSAFGISRRMAQMLELSDVEVLVPNAAVPDAGLGAVGNLPRPMAPDEFARYVKQTFGSAALRMSADNPGFPIVRVALCGGSGAEFVSQAIAAGAQAYVTADCKHNQFIDHNHRILLIDAGHYETELCSVQIFSEILTEKFPNFAVAKAMTDSNPVIAL